MVDGVNVGAEDTTRPYAIPWDTRTTSNGSHTIRAVARDLLGARWWSDPVSVTVFNDVTPPVVSINQAATQVDPTSSAPIVFTAVFSEAVRGFIRSDVAIGGPAGGAPKGPPHR